MTFPTFRGWHNDSDTRSEYTSLHPNANTNMVRNLSKPQLAAVGRFTKTAETACTEGRNVKQLTIKTGKEDDFFNRGREIARAVDLSETPGESCIISFEDPCRYDEAHYRGAIRLISCRAVKEMPGSITEVAHRLHRNLSAVKRDIDVLAQAGLLSIAPKILPGHGQKKEVRAVATQIRLLAEVS